jgi:hypothetical protein
LVHYRGADKFPNGLANDGGTNVGADGFATWGNAFSDFDTDAGWRGANPRFRRMAHSMFTE